MLDLSMNDLGKVPEAIMSLINLQQLCLNDTDIDYVPANIGRLSNLRILELRDNNLCELPKSIRRLTNLQRLDVSDNNLSNLVSIFMTLFLLFICEKLDYSIVCVNLLQIHSTINTYSLYIFRQKWVNPMVI